MNQFKIHELLPIDKDVYLQQADYVDYDTSIMSGGFQRVQSYKNLSAFGVAIMPHLIQDLRIDPDWWRVQMVSEIAARDFSQNVLIARDIRGQLLPVRSAYIRWWNNFVREAMFDELV